MDDLDEELIEIKREIIESRGLIIKTNNLASALSADLRTVAKRQQTFERTAFFNSAFAFLIFAAVVVGAVYFAWNARVDSMVRATGSEQERAKKAIAELEEVKKDLEARAAAESAALAFYELSRSGRRRDVIEAFAKLRERPLTRAELLVFTDLVEKARSDLSVETYQAGLDHVRGGRYVEAAKAFEESLALSDGGSHTPSVKLELARALRKLKRQREAIAILTPLSEASSNPDVLDDATMLLAECLMDLEAYNDAKSTLRAFIRRFPDSPMLRDAQMALSDLNLKR
jgi:TolA-binding protein